MVNGGLEGCSGARAVRGWGGGGLQADGRAEGVVGGGLWSEGAVPELGWPSAIGVLVGDPQADRGCGGDRWGTG